MSDRRAAIVEAVDARPSRRRAGDRRQGPRAGPGVRRTAARCPSTTSRSRAKRSSGRAWSVAETARDEALDAERIAERCRRGAAAQARRALAETGPLGRASTRARLEPGELFVGLRGQQRRRGSPRRGGPAAGAWGVLARAEHAGRSPPEPRAEPCSPTRTRSPPCRRWLGPGGASWEPTARGWWRSPARPARPRRRTSWRRCSGPTSPTAASPANLNTEIGLPLAILAARRDSEALVLEMAMRGPGQIAELTEIADPDVGVIVNVGPAHLELLGSLEAIAAAKAELIAGHARRGARSWCRPDEPLLAPHLRADLRTITFGEGGDVSLLGCDPDGTRVDRPRGPDDRAAALVRPAAQPAQPAGGRGGRAGARARPPRARLTWTSQRCAAQRIELARRGGADRRLLQRQPDVDARRDRGPRRHAPAVRRRVAVLGDMLELGLDGPRLHREIGAHARARRRRAARDGRAAGQRDARAVRRRGARAGRRRSGSRAAARAAARPRHGAGEGLAWGWASSWS